MAHRLFAAAASRAAIRHHASHAALSPRQREIAELLVQGLSDKEIAARLMVSVNTVRCHMRNLRATLGLHSRVQIAVYVLASDN